jgi:hypothetical protein
LTGIIIQLILEEEEKNNGNDARWVGFLSIKEDF